MAATFTIAQKFAALCEIANKTASERQGDGKPTAAQIDAARAALDAIEANFAAL